MKCKKKYKKEYQKALAKEEFCLGADYMITQDEIDRIRAQAKKNVRREHPEWFKRRSQ